MISFSKCLAAAAALVCATTLPAWAESSASSAVSDSVSTSVGSISRSIQRSSDSSSKGNDVAEGDYRIIEMAQQPQRPGTVQLTLRAVADPAAAGALMLLLPQEAVAEGRLAEGRIVTVRQRPYGLEFSSGTTQQPFFLALRDEWFQELQTRVVRL
jgi:hypothetical protein